MTGYVFVVDSVVGSVIGFVTGILFVYMITRNKSEKVQDDGGEFDSEFYQKGLPLFLAYSK